MWQRLWNLKYMKQIIAIIRDERVEDTKLALGVIGIQGVTFMHCTGRGQKKGNVSNRELFGLKMHRASSPDCEELPVTSSITRELSDTPDTEFSFGFLPKRMLILVVSDEEVDRIVQAIVNANRTGRPGDGRIIICPMIGAIRIRTGEQGNKALS